MTKILVQLPRRLAAWGLLCVAAACSAEIDRPTGTANPRGPVANMAARMPPAPPRTGDGAAPTLTAGPRLPRLSHFQWENTVRDLLRQDRPLGLADGFQKDVVVGFDNDNGGPELDINPDLRADYESAAEAVAARIASDDALYRALLPADLPMDPTARSAAFVRHFGQRAYRRPLTAGDESELLSLFKMAPALLGPGDAFRGGVRLVVNLVLQSPHFLYRPELSADGKLTPFQVASRLSYALTDSMPDDALFAAAQADRLATGADVRREALRLLALPAARATVDHFHAQLYQLASYEQVSKDAKMFPAFAPVLASDLREEARLFLGGVVAQGGSAADLLTAPFSFVNARLAAAYGGLGGGFDDGFRRVTLDARQRVGFLGHLGFLAAKAGPRDTDPIHRGVFISQVILCRPLPPPSANVPPVPAATGKTTRARVEAHTGKGTCGEGCHDALINPLGFAFENYDAAGRVRATDNGQPVDTTGTYQLSGTPVRFANALELTRAMASSNDFQACYLGNWLQYLVGRGRRDGDSAFIDHLTRLSRDGRGIREVLAEAVAHDAFLGRGAP